MQVTKTNADGLKHEFKVVVPAGHLAEKAEARLAEVGRTVKIPGFRPGKVPMPLLKKKYGPSVLGEVLEAVVDEGARHALTEHKLRPALQPKIEITSYAEGQDLEFSVAVEVLPEIELKDLSALSLEKPVAAVEDSEIDAALKNMAERSEKSEPAAADHAAEAGDIVKIDFLGKLNGEPFAGGKAEGYSLKLGSNTFIPGFEDQLVGAKAGEDRVVQVTFPEDYGAEELAGKAVEFECKVHEVAKPVPATIDDDLAKNFGMDSLDALKTAIREQIQGEYASLSRAKVKRALLDKLADEYDFVLPVGMVDLEFDAIWKQIEADKAANRLDADDAAKSEDDLKAEYRRIAERRVRLGLLLSEIGRQNNVTITQEDLNRAVLAEARRFPGQEHLVFQYYQKNEDALNSLRAPVFEDKVVDLVLERAQVSEKTVSVDDLRKDADEAAKE